MKTYIVDSFTDQPFKGNPAGVCFAETFPPEDIMQKIAMELNLSETAFVVPLEKSGTFAIRFFSPKTEIPLCGHATLASAKIIFERGATGEVCFKTVRNVDLAVCETRGQITMRFPLYETRAADVPEALLDALGLPDVISTVYNTENNIVMLEIKSPEELRGLNPDFDKLQKSIRGINGVLVTSPGLAGYDFYSRFFWPWSGTNEDPVTGATHTFLAPYWAEILGKKKLKSFQCSERTGFMDLEVLDSALMIRGNAIIIFEGKLRI